MQEIIVTIIGLLTLIYIGWNVYKLFAPKYRNSNCGCEGCSGCNLKELKGLKTK